MEFKVCAWWRSPRVVPDGVVPDWHDADMEPWAEGAVAARLERRRLARRRSENKEKEQEDEAEARPRKVRITSANAAPLLGRTRARHNATVEA
jgi:hypothetical protein